MRVKVLYFAAAADAVGRRSEEVELPEGSSVGELVDRLCAEHPGLVELAGRLLLSVDRAYVTADHPLRGGEEVALIPPVSGGGEDGPAAPSFPAEGLPEGGEAVDETGRFRLTRRPISAEELVASVAHVDAGAVLLFLGTVRKTTGEGEAARITRFLQYEAYPAMALGTMAQIGREVAERWPEARLAITHRIGELRLGEVSVGIACSAPHRARAYEASRYAIERLKVIVPIWKKEHWEDGESGWVGLP